jgi:hypothetical protein
MLTPSSNFEDNDQRSEGKKGKEWLAWVAATMDSIARRVSSTLCVEFSSSSTKGAIAVMKHHLPCHAVIAERTMPERKRVEETEPEPEPEPLKHGMASEEIISTWISTTTLRNSIQDSQRVSRVAGSQ